MHSDGAADCQARLGAGGRSPKGCWPNQQYTSIAAFHCAPSIILHRGLLSVKPNRWKASEWSPCERSHIRPACLYCLLMCRNNLGHLSSTTPRSSPRLSTILCPYICTHTYGPSYSYGQLSSPSIYPRSGTRDTSLALSGLLSGQDQ